MRSSNKTVLFASELGSGLGHVAPLSLIADRLAASDPGIRLVFVAGNGIDARAMLGRRYPILPAPTLQQAEVNQSHSASYAEILGRFGYTRAAHLRASVAAWDDIFDMLEPDLVLAEHSPTAALAARGRVPTMLLGNGYTLPPPDMPVFPALTAGMAPPAMQSIMLERVNDLLRERGQAALQHLPQLLTGSARALLTLPQLDPYAAIRKEPFLGSYHQLRPAPLPTEPHIFIYGGADEWLLNPLVQAAARAGCGLSAYLGEQDTAARQFLRQRGALVHDKPPALDEVLKKASLVISHGGSGLAHAALMMGRPQLVVPIHAESELTAGRLVQLGVARAVERGGGIWQIAEQRYEADLSEALDVLLQVRSIAEQAQAIAHQIAERYPSRDAVGEIAEVSRNILSA